MRIAFISCVSKKRSGVHAAKDLYSSDLFIKSYAFCSANYDKVFILSAKYGLLRPNDVIESYDATLKGMNYLYREGWARGVMRALKIEIKLSDELFFYCGILYRKYLMQWLPNSKHAPLAHLGIGQQLKWYKDHL